MRGEEVTMVSSVRRSRTTKVLRKLIVLIFRGFYMLNVQVFWCSFKVCDLVRILGAGETLLMQTLVLADADAEPIVRWHNGSYTLSHTCTSISFIFYQASVRRRSWPTQAPQSILLLFSGILSLTISFQPS